MSKIFDRDTLQKAFPDNPRMVALLERLDAKLASVHDGHVAVTEQLGEVAATVADTSKFQPRHVILDAVASLPNRVGAVELTAEGQSTIRPIDGQDPASLLSRGAAYAVTIGYAGQGPTAARPTFPSGYCGIYFDTTIDPDGQPIIRRGDGQWLNMSGVPV